MSKKQFDANNFQINITDARTPWEIYVLPTNSKRPLLPRQIKPEPLSPIPKIYGRVTSDKLKFNENLFTVTGINPASAVSAELSCAPGGCCDAAQNPHALDGAYCVHPPVTNGIGSDTEIVVTSCAVSIN